MINKENNDRKWTINSKSHQKKDGYLKSSIIINPFTGLKERKHKLGISGAKKGHQNRYYRH